MVKITEGQPNASTKKKFLFESFTFAFLTFSTGTFCMFSKPSAMSV